MKLPPHVLRAHKQFAQRAAIIAKLWKTPLTASTPKKGHK